MSKITVTDRIAYDLYRKGTPNDTPVICIEGFIKYKSIDNNYKKYYMVLRKEKLKKIKECQK